MCGQSRVNLQKSQNPDETWMIFGSTCFVSETDHASFLKKKKDGGGGRWYNAVQEHKQAQTKIDTTRHCPRMYRFLAGLVAVPTMGMIANHQVVVVVAVMT